MKLTLLFTLILISLLTNAQRVGIGTTNPNAKLEIVGDGSNGLTNALMLKNSLNDTLLRIKNDGRINIRFNGPSTGRSINLGGNGLNFFSDDTTFSGAVFPTDTSLVIWSEVRDNNYVVLQPSWGNVGIGTYRPLAKVHVHGDFKLGVAGSLLNHIIKASIIRNIPTIAAGASVIELFTLTGALINSSVMISPEIALTDGLVIAYARVSAANTVEVKFLNNSAASINLASTTFHITVVN